MCDHGNGAYSTIEYATVVTTDEAILQFDSTLYLYLFNFAVTASNNNAYSCLMN